MDPLVICLCGNAVSRARAFGLLKCSFLIEDRRRTMKSLTMRGQRHAHGPEASDEGYIALELGRVEIGGQIPRKILGSMERHERKATVL